MEVTMEETMVNEELKTKMQEEAIKRMRFLNLLEQPIAEFTQGKLNRSEGPGLLYWLSDREKEIVERFEKGTGAMVYHVIKTVYVNLGTMYSLLYVSKDQDDWSYEWGDLKMGEPMAYVVNETDDLCSEYGVIGVEQVNGGLRRAY